MPAQRYSVTQYPIETLLTWVKSGEIAIPEIQRPFVWDSTKVRNLLDSLYSGFPVGYPLLRDMKRNDEAGTLLEKDRESRKPVQPPNKPKIGRNEPCACGSGKKYKKCCLGKDQL